MKEGGVKSQRRHSAQEAREGFSNSESTPKVLYDFGPDIQTPWVAATLCVKKGQTNDSRSLL